MTGPKWSAPHGAADVSYDKIFFQRKGAHTLQMRFLFQILIKVIRSKKKQGKTKWNFLFKHQVTYFIFCHMVASNDAINHLENCVCDNFLILIIHPFF